MRVRGMECEKLCTLYAGGGDALCMNVRYTCVGGIPYFILGKEGLRRLQCMCLADVYLAKITEARTLLVCSLQKLQCVCLADPFFAKHDSHEARPYHPQTLVPVPHVYIFTAPPPNIIL